jgi:YggT family protein
MRLILAWVGADYHNPITQFVVKMTSFFIKPMKKFLPDIRGIETSTLVAIILVEVIKFFLITVLSFGLPNIFGLIILGIGDFIQLLIWALSIALILQVILSWVQPGSHVHQTLDKFTSPLMRPFQRVLPPVAGIDISPIPALIILQLLIIVLVNPMKGVGLGMAIGS